MPLLFMVVYFNIRNEKLHPSVVWWCHVISCGWLLRTKTLRECRSWWWRLVKSQVNGEGLLSANLYREVCIKSRQACHWNVIFSEISVRKQRPYFIVLSSYPARSLAGAICRTRFPSHRAVGWLCRDGDGKTWFPKFEGCAVDSSCVLPVEPSSRRGASQAVGLGSIIALSGVLCCSLPYVVPPCVLTNLAPRDLKIYYNQI